MVLELAKCWLNDGGEEERLSNFLNRLGNRAKDRLINLSGQMEFFGYT